MNDKNGCREEVYFYVRELDEDPCEIYECCEKCPYYDPTKVEDE